jgi:hypothetical protein
MTYVSLVFFFFLHIFLIFHPLFLFGPLASVLSKNGAVDLRDNWQEFTIGYELCGHATTYTGQ